MWTKGLIMVVVGISGLFITLICIVIQYKISKAHNQKKKTTYQLNMPKKAEKNLYSNETKNNDQTVCINNKDKNTDIL